MAKTSAWVFGVIFIIAGVWGFFGGNTAVGFLAADWLSSLVHVVVGVVLLALAAKPAVVNTLKAVGVVYVVIAVLGFIQGSWVLGGVFATSQVSNWFYLVVGIVIAVLGFVSRDSVSSSPSEVPQM